MDNYDLSMKKINGNIKAFLVIITASSKHYLRDSKYSKKL